MCGGGGGGEGIPQPHTLIKLLQLAKKKNQFLRQTVATTVNILMVVAGEKKPYRVKDFNNAAHKRF